MNDLLERLGQLWKRRTGEHTPLHAAPFSGAVPRVSLTRRVGVLVGSTAVLTLAAAGLGRGLVTSAPAPDHGQLPSTDTGYSTPGGLQLVIESASQFPLFSNAPRPETAAADDVDAGAPVATTDEDDSATTPPTDVPLAATDQPAVDPPPAQPAPLPPAPPMGVYPAGGAAVLIGAAGQTNPPAPRPVPTAAAPSSPPPSDTSADDGAPPTDLVSDAAATPADDADAGGSDGPGGPDSSNAPAAAPAAPTPAPRPVVRAPASTTSKPAPSHAAPPPAPAVAPAPPPPADDNNGTHDHGQNGGGPTIDNPGKPAQPAQPAKQEQQQPQQQGKPPAPAPTATPAHGDNGQAQSQSVTDQPHGQPSDDKAGKAQSPAKSNGGGNNASNGNNGGNGGNGGGHGHDN